MAKTAGTKPKSPSLNSPSASDRNKKGARKPLADVPPTAGGKGDRDGKGDIQAKKANTSSAKKSASK